MEHTERELLEEAIIKSEGNITHAARILGMKRTTFRDKLSKHGLI
jgi:DNA-binding protein Fis